MNKYKVPFYFVLYLVVLVELLLVIVERDNTEKELKDRLAEYATIQDSVIAMYSKPILLDIEEETDWVISGRDSLHLIVSVTNLQTPEEKADVKYFISTGNDENDSYHKLVTDKKTGNGNFYFRTNKNGTYNFNVFCSLRRQLPRYLPQVILDGIFEKVGTDFKTSSDTVNFKIKAKQQLQTFDKPGRG